MATKLSPKQVANRKAYNAQPEMVNRREDNNRARYQALKAGTAHKGDGKDVAHTVPLDKGGTTDASNLKVVDAKKNRSWRKGQKGYNVPVAK